MSYTRRDLLKRSGTLAALGTIGTLPHPLYAMLPREHRRIPHNVISLLADPNVKALSDVALNAAKSAGAVYADVRFTHTFTRDVSIGSVWDSESMTLGVRALVEGYWGFAASPIWTPDEAARLARAAVENAKANTLGKPRVIELAPVAAIDNGQWSTPIKDDPFITSEDEIGDFLTGLLSFIQKLPHVGSAYTVATFIRQDKAYASTENQFVTQRFYQTQGIAQFVVIKNQERQKGVALDTITPAGLGFEYLREQPLRDQIVARHEEAMKDMELPLKPVDVGRYALVFDAPSVAQLVSATIGSATELDRAMGYEANAGGTSYITDPQAMIGTLKIGAPALTVTGNRMEAAGAATVKWDDEGVSPREFTVVKDGILTDMQTNREGAGWLKEQYAKRNLPFASHGCAYAPEGIHVPLTHCANLRMQAATTDATFETLIANTTKGLAIKRASVDMDFQQVTGLGGGETFEIKNGKRVAEIQGAGFLFRTPELWTALAAVGGSASLRRFGIEATKGQPEQTSTRSVTAPPIAIKELSIIDPTRKA